MGRKNLHTSNLSLTSDASTSCTLVTHHLPSHSVRTTWPTESFTIGLSGYCGKVEKLSYITLDTSKKKAVFLKSNHLHKILLDELLAVDVDVVPHVLALVDHHPKGTNSLLQYK